MWRSTIHPNRYFNEYIIEGNSNFALPLILKNKDFDDQNTCVNTFKRFEKNNIEKNRIILKGESKTRKELLNI